MHAYLRIIYANNTIETRYHCVHLQIVLKSKVNGNPTGPFTILGPQNQEIGEFYTIQERRATDLEAPCCERVGQEPSSIGLVLNTHRFRNFFSSMIYSNSISQPFMNTHYNEP